VIKKQLPAARNAASSVIAIAGNVENAVIVSNANFRSRS
jgi:hypothetical protein